MQPAGLQSWLPLLAIGLVMALRWRSMSRPRPLRPAFLLVTPLVVGAAALALAAVRERQREVVDLYFGAVTEADGAYIRRSAAVNRIPCLTTAAAALAAAESTLDRAQHPLRVRTLQEHQGLVPPGPDRHRGAGAP